MEKKVSEMEEVETNDVLELVYWNDSRDPLGFYSSICFKKDQVFYDTTLLVNIETKPGSV